MASSRFRRYVLLRIRHRRAYAAFSPLGTTASVKPRAPHLVPLGTSPILSPPFVAQSLASSWHGCLGAHYAIAIGVDAPTRIVIQTARFIVVKNVSRMQRKCSSSNNRAQVPLAPRKGTPFT